MPPLDGKRLYVDTNVFIFIGEQHPELGEPARFLFENAHAGNYSLVTSELTLAEALVLPFRLENENLVALYLEALAPRSYLEVIPVTRQVLIECARIRASNSTNKLPDAIHLATAVVSDCAVFVSADRGIRPPDGLDFVMLQDLGQAL